MGEESWVWGGVGGTLLGKRVISVGKGGLRVRGERAISEGGTSVSGEGERPVKGRESVAGWEGVCTVGQGRGVIAEGGG